MGKPTFEKLSGAISLVSNTPGMPTGYGQQGEYLVERMLRHNLDVAVLSNYGHEGTLTTLDIGGKSIPHYPRGLKQYSEDVIRAYHLDFTSQFPNKKNAVFTLYDVWVYDNLPKSDEFDVPIISWVPLDHVSLPPLVHKFLLRENVQAVTMSPHGQRQLEKAGIDSIYIPHGIDLKVYKPTEFMSDGSTVREYLDIGGEFLVGMVAANKANGLVHRKAYAEQLLAFSMFLQKKPDAKLYIHAEASASMGGFDLPALVKACGIPEGSVIFPDPLAHRLGFSQQDLAALYSSFDVLLHAGYGEGFGICGVEAQACGTRVITSDWAATADLASEDSWLVPGSPWWDEPQKSWMQIPNINAIAQALEMASEMERGPSEYAVEFAKQFDVETVWHWRWLPYLRKLFK